MAKTALSQLSPDQPTVDQGFVDDDVPFCYMQTTNGEFMDLTQFCGSNNRRQQTASTPVSLPVAPTPAIVVPTAPVTGESACFVFDAQGQPCISSR